MKGNPADVPVRLTFACGTTVTVTWSFLERLRLTIIGDSYLGCVRKPESTTS
jgi:hypothetical protein